MLCYHNQYNNKLSIIKLKYLIKKSKTENEKEKPKKQTMRVCAHVCLIYIYVCKISNT